MSVYIKGEGYDIIGFKLIFSEPNFFQNYNNLANVASNSWGLTNVVN